MCSAIILIPDPSAPRPRGLRKRAKPEKAQYARSMRNNPTQVEALLWQRLRSRQCDGFKIRRQAVVLGWIADFYCPEVRLVIELDGPYHSSRIEQDQRRDLVMCRAGIAVLRLSNDMIDRDIDTALEHVKLALKYAKTLPDINLGGQR
jgi:very-short-patch-repair endonuclease